DDRALSRNSLGYRNRGARVKCRSEERMKSIALVAGVIILCHRAVGTAAPTEKGHTFQAPGATIYVETLGSDSGVPLVVVNGGPGFHHTYEHVALPGTTSAWETLARKRRVVFYDQRGNGRSG